MSFSSESLHKSLKDIFGFNSFKGRQEEIIKNLLEGKDGMVIMPTGGGKSMRYQLPALVSDSLAIVISPLIASLDLTFLFLTRDTNEHKIVTPALGPSLGVAPSGT